jgi:hypothetical protein
MKWIKATRTAMVALALTSCDLRPQENLVPYQTFETWNQGQGRAIVIDSEHRNWVDLESLGLQLLSETRNQPQTLIMLFGDLRAAQMRGHIDNMSKADQDYFSQHSLGTFRRLRGNRAEYEFSPDGMYGRYINIRYEENAVSSVSEDVFNRP